MLFCGGQVKRDTLVSYFVVELREVKVQHWVD